MPAFYHRHEIRCNDIHLMTVDTEMLQALCSSIDKTETVPFARCELEFGDSSITEARIGCLDRGTVEVILAVDEVVVRYPCADGNSWIVARSHGFHDELKVLFVVMVLEEDGTDIDIVLVILWSMDDHCTNDAGYILLTVMRMIPRGSVEVGKEAVGVSVSGSDWALLNSRNTIHIRLSSAIAKLREIQCFVGEGRANGGKSLL